MTSDLPQFLRDLLSACPQAGAGVRRWLYRCARQLHAHYSDSTEILRLLEAASHGCGRVIPHREIVAAVEDARKTAWQPSGQGPSYRPEPKWPSLNQEQREAIIRDGFKLADLWEESPVRIDWNGSRTEEIIDQLFPGNPLLCCGKSSSEFATRSREKWRGRLGGRTPAALAETGGDFEDTTNVPAPSRSVNRRLAVLLVSRFVLVSPCTVCGSQGHPGVYGLGSPLSSHEKLR